MAIFSTSPNFNVPDGLKARSCSFSIAEKLISALQAPLVVQEHALHITTSIGICVYPQDGADTDALLRNADTAMYQAKAAGRNRIEFAPTQGFPEPSPAPA